MRTLKRAGLERRVGRTVSSCCTTTRTMVTVPADQPDQRQCRPGAHRDVRLRRAVAADLRELRRRPDAGVHLRPDGERADEDGQRGRQRHTYGYDNANRLTVCNGGSYTHDLNGNTLMGAGPTNTWDGQVRLTQCVYNGTTSHTYGADSLR
jgi:hypothetical protein